ncbi:8-oxo-dGTP diphosphatase [Actinomyces denticolens]|uniref:8-oxo-dGTP diphosphatase n=2 Tax=Actinomyces denticolens TaxID=52767 RepID=A0ABY1IC70_9ACTO|nr:8-oxo-dGTP diphosphatase [Actinomyces denticolens]
MRPGKGTAGAPRPGLYSQRMSAPARPARPSSGRLVVAAAILDSLARPTSMLCAARSYPPQHAGEYELPGGKVESGEEPVTALARELAEEIGASVRLGAEVVPPAALAVPPPPPRREHPGDCAPAWAAMNGHRMRVWLAEPDGDRPPRCGKAHQSLDWVRLGELDALPWLPADAPILRAIRSTLARGARS